MCGRYTLRSSGQTVATLFALADEPSLQPRFNIAPTQQILAIRQENDKRQACFLHWGLIPSWAKDKKIGASLINARAETVAEKPSFRAAFKRRRCLILADGFYEWQKVAKKGPKQAFHFRLRNDQPFAFAGLWENWTGEEPPVTSCTIITTTPNDVLRPVHDRMPVILQPRDYARWLDPTPTDPGVLQEMLRPYPADEMNANPVGPYVNNAKNEGPDCIRKT